MIPISDDNPTLRFPLVTVLLLLALGATWIFVQGAGFDPSALAASVCNWGMIPGEITFRARVGDGLPLGNGMACLVDAEPRNLLTPLTSMFLHGGWAHLLGNSLFLWIFGNNVEDIMGRFRFIVFYLVCGLAAAAAQALIDPASIVPMVGASGAISGVLGAYLILYPAGAGQHPVLPVHLHQGDLGAGLGDAALLDRYAGGGGAASAHVDGDQGHLGRGGLGAHRRIHRRRGADQDIQEPGAGARAHGGAQPPRADAAIAFSG